MQGKSIAVMVFLTFLGMVGLYVGLYMAWQKYQQYAPTIQKVSAELSSAGAAGSSVPGLITGLLGSA